MSQVTQILQTVEHGDATAAAQLLPLVYQELRRLAAYKMAREAPGQTLHPTALVHEAWLRLTGAESKKWDSQGHFFAAAAEAMRRILIERARAKSRLRRGAHAEHVSLDHATVATNAIPEPMATLNGVTGRLKRVKKAPVFDGSETFITSTALIGPVGPVTFPTATASPEPLATTAVPSMFAASTPLRS